MKERTNTQETKLQLESDKHSHLTLQKEDDFIDRLVQYASDGAGNISMQVRGLNKRIQTDNSIIEASIDEIDISSATASAWSNIQEPTNK
ncbi:MAG: hypothetical protein R2911_44880 [Caldilineaceae bacterium]